MKYIKEIKLINKNQYMLTENGTDQLVHIINGKWKLD
jgi:hypothetical protein